MHDTHRITVNLDTGHRRIALTLVLSFVSELSTWQRVQSIVKQRETVLFFFFFMTLTEELVYDFVNVP